MTNISIHITTEGMKIDRIKKILKNYERWVTSQGEAIKQIKEVVDEEG